MTVAVILIVVFFRCFSLLDGEQVVRILQAVLAAFVSGNAVERISEKFKGGE